MECLCPCYAWLKPWLCNHNRSPTTEADDDDDEDFDDANGVTNDPLELVELQRKLERNPCPSPEGVNDVDSTQDEKITVIVNNEKPPGNLKTLGTPGYFQSFNEPKTFYNCTSKGLKE